jgi:spermidine/putrescine transport system permease protein
MRKLKSSQVLRYGGVVGVFFWFLIFACLPMLLMLVISFMQSDDAHLVRWHFTLTNYQQLLSPLFFRIFIHSFEFALACTVITLFLAYPAAYFISICSNRVKPVLMLMMVVPFWTSSLVRTYAMMALVKTKGLVNTALLALGVIHKPLLMLYTDPAMLIGLAYNLLPYMVLPLYSNFEKLDYRLFDAARDLGASRWQVFSRITLPLTLPGILTGVLFVFLPAMTLFYIPDLLGGAHGVLLGNLVKAQFVTMSDWPGGAATSVVLTVILLVMLGCIRWRVKQSQLQELV